MKRCIWGMVLALALAEGTAHAQSTSKEKLAAYCIGVFQVHIAHSLLSKDGSTLNIAPMWQDRLKKVREYVLQGGRTTAEYNELERELEAGLDDANECFKTSHERGRFCYAEANKGGVIDDKLYMDCHERWQPDSCRRGNRCAELSK